MTRNNDYSISLWIFYKLQTDHTLSAPIYLSKIPLILQGLSQCPALAGCHVIISISLHCKKALPVLLSSEGTTHFLFCHYALLLFNMLSWPVITRENPCSSAWPTRPAVSGSWQFPGLHPLTQSECLLNSATLAFSFVPHICHVFFWGCLHYFLLWSSKHCLHVGTS